MANKKTKTENKQFTPIAFSSDVFKGIYSNVALIQHTKREFIFDFVLQVKDHAEVVSRIIMSPEQTKDFQKALNENIKLFDEKKQ